MMHGCVTACSSTLTQLPHLNVYHLLLFGTNIHVAGDTTSSGTDDHHTTSVVAGVMSLVIILVSGVAAFVIILFLLKIWSQSLILQ